MRKIGPPPRVSTLHAAYQTSQLDRPERGSENMTISLPVRIPGHVNEHEVVVGIDVLGELKGRMASLKLSRAALIISSPTVFDLYGAKVDAALKAAGCEMVAHHLFPDDEENKNLDTWQEILKTINTLERVSKSKLLIVNLGGGVVGDIGAYAAACYARGRDYIQLPTTLLGQVDCGIGGKCGVNFQGKNLIGVFYQPRLILADLRFLKSLPRREILSGLAEVIKYGVILDSSLLDYVETNLDAILSLDLGVMEYVVRRCFELKIRVVEQDERDEKGIRAILNFGHTVGHALETSTDYTAYTHGEAISVGMLCACEIAEGLGMFSSNLTRRVEKLLLRAGLPTMASANIDLVMKNLQTDKKFDGTNQTNRFVLPTALGKVKFINVNDQELIRKVVSRRITTQKIRVVG